MIKLTKLDLQNEEKKRVLKVFDSGFIAQGPQVKKLERQIAQLCGTKYAVATNNGTSALHTALYAIDTHAGDEIITTPFSFIATVNSILMIGAIPKFVDIEEKTFNLDPKQIEEKITKKTKAILVADLYGQPANYNEINKVAKKYNLKVIEDAAQAIGATYQGKKTGNLGDIGCFSFYATKNIVSGEGGMITMNDKDYFERAVQFRNHGQLSSKIYQYVDLGYNYRMMDIQAVILLSQLKRISKIIEQRNAIAERYNTAFVLLKGLITPIIDENRTHTFNQYTVRITKEYLYGRNQFQNILYRRNIETKVYYPHPLFFYKHLRKFQGKRDAYPVAQKISTEVISIPVRQNLEASEINSIIKVIQSI